MKSKLFIILIIICSILSTIEGIYTGQWQKFSFLAFIFLLLITPTYIASYKNWKLGLLEPAITLLLSVIFITTRQLYTISQIKGLREKTVILITAVALWLLIWELLVITYSYKNYTKNTEKYENFSAYFAKKEIPDLREKLKTGIKTLLNGEKKKKETTK
ncbi:MAG: hypothetical protein RR272_00105 [Synergistaceae bacterium]